jgi:hypothetical protein
LGVRDHGAELEATEGNAVLADALVGEEQRPAVFADQDGKIRQRGRDSRSNKRGGDEVEQPLEGARPGAGEVVPQGQEEELMPEVVVHRVPSSGRPRIGGTTCRSSQ